MSFPHYTVLTLAHPLGSLPEHGTVRASNLIGMLHAMVGIGLAEINAPMPTEIRVGIKGSDDPSFELSVYFIALLQEEFGGEDWALNVTPEGIRFQVTNVEGADPNQ